MSCYFFPFVTLDECNCGSSKRSNETNQRESDNIFVVKSDHSAEKIMLCYVKKVSLKIYLLSGVRKFLYDGCEVYAVIIIGSLFVDVPNTVYFKTEHYYPTG